jgi:site-specific recombinase XerD
MSVWFDGPHPVTGQRIRRSLETGNWKAALRDLDRWKTNELAGEGDAKADESLAEPAARSVATAIEDYLRDCRNRNLSASTLVSYTRSLGHFAEFAGAVPVSSISVEDVRSFRSARAEKPGRDDGTFVTPLTLRKEIEHLRGFLQFCVDSEWLKVNVARKVKPPKSDSLPTLPFSHDEVKKLLDA